MGTKVVSELPAHSYMHTQQLSMKTTTVVYVFPMHRLDDGAEIFTIDLGMETSL